MLNAIEKRRLHQRAPSSLREATIQDPPLTDDGFLRVELDGAPGAIHECPWPYNPDGQMPVGDDAAAVVESDGGNFWAVAWWPNDGEPPTGGGGGGGGGAATGVAGGVLSGNYPDPGFAQDMATQAELDAEALARTNADAAEVTARTNAVNAEATARVNADNAEAGARAAADALRQLISEKDQPNGYAGLDAGGKVKTAALPALAITSVSVVATQAAQLALVAQEGDVAVRSDTNQTYVHNAGTAGTMADWTLMATPGDLVLSVAGKTGAVTLVKADVGLGNVDNTSDANKPVSTATQAALNLKTDATNGQVATPSLLQARQLSAVTALAQPGEIAYDPITGQLRYRDSVRAIDRTLSRLYSDTVPTVRAYMTNVAQSIPTGGALSPVVFGAETWDTAAMHDTVTNAGRFVAPASGKYLVTTQLQGTVNVGQSSETYMSIHKVSAAGDTIVADAEFVEYIGRIGGEIVDMAAGDYLYLSVNNNSGSTMQFSGPVDRSNHFMMTWIGGSGPTVSEVGVPAVSAYITGGAQAVAAGGNAIVNFASEEYDTDQMHDTVSLTSRFVCKTPGIYAISGLLGWNVTTGGYNRVVILKNGAGLTPEINGANSLSGQWHTLSGHIKLAAGDYIEMQALNGTSSGLTISVARLQAILVTTGKTVIPRARAMRSAAYNIPVSGAMQKIPLDALDGGLDNDAMWDAANSRFVIKTAGTYVCNAQLSTGSTAATVIQAEVRVNNVQRGLAQITPKGGGTSDRYQVGTGAIDLAVGDTVELWLFHNATAVIAMNLTDDGGVGNWLSAVKVGLSGSGGDNRSGFSDDGAGQIKADSKVRFPSGVYIEPWHLIGAVGEPGFSNGWVNYGGAEDVAGYRKADDGRVTMKGLIKNGTVNTTMFTLPAGYRPLTIKRFPVITNSGMGYVSVAPSGAVSNAPGFGDNVYLDLSSISFYID